MRAEPRDLADPPDQPVICDSLLTATDAVG